MKCYMISLLHAFILIKDEYEKDGVNDDMAEESVPSGKRNKYQVSDGSQDQEVGLGDQAGGWKWVGL